MARRKINNVNKDSEFYECMFGMRLDISQADEAVKLLEGIPANSTTSFARDFCISYIIKFLEKYCQNDDDYELALASYGFLDGFSYMEYKSVQERVESYWRYASQYNRHEFIKASWSPISAVSILKDEHIAIIGYLDEITSKIKSENDGKLGLIEKVPEKLDFPKPRKIEETNGAEQEEGQQNTADGGAGEQVKPYSEGQNGTGSKKLFQTIQEKAKVLIGFLKMRFTTRDIIAVLILSFMAVGVWEIAQFLKSSEASPKPAETDSDMAIAENEAPTITGITIYNTKITLTPDKPWETLRVSIYPREANIDDVNYYSDNIHLVTVNRSTERVKLAPEWKKQTEQSTKVHVQFEEIDAEALVNVQEHSDDSVAASSPGSNEPVNTESIPGF